MDLKKLVVHDCQPPELADERSEHRWVCPGCYASWRWTPGMAAEVVEQYGFLGLRRRHVGWRSDGWWAPLDSEPRKSWVDVDA
jgi:hypothetical protein